MAKYITHPTPKSGIPLGGIGAGSIELRPDGEFHEWQIANPQKFSIDCRDIRNADKGEGLAGSLSFYLREEQDGKVILRRLGMGFGSGQGIGEEEYNYRMYSFNKTVEEIEYEAKFPLAQLKYNDSALPLDIRLSACCPFVPYDSQTSATPGIYLTFKVKNTSDKAVKVSLAGKLKNILPDSGRRNRILTTEDGAALSMDVVDDNKAGNLTLAVSGGEISAIAGDYERYMNEYVSHGEFGVVEESFLFGLRRSGRLPFNAENSEIFKPEWCSREKFETLSDSEVEEELDRLRRFGFADSIIERNTATIPELDTTPEGKRRLLRCIYRNGRDIERDGKWGDGAICSSFELESGEKKEISFTLAWYFPNLVSGAGRVVGHVYENYFSDSIGVSDFMRENREYILTSVQSFSDNLYNTGFPESFADSVSEQLANLVKSSWWVKDGSFGIWEGLGSCGFHTTDITYHGSFGIITLFPELQKTQMEMGARFQREDGRVHHFFTPDFTTVDDGFDRVDMNPQFVLLVCRDYFATGDRAYLERMWRHVVRAMDSIEQLDSNGDALPDKNASRNTYDAWHFCGTSTYISVLWLASLKAASAMAEIMGEADRKAHWDALVEKGRAAVEEKLFNGRYYDLWVDGDKVDRCCMTDQLDGEYFSRLIGLGGILDDEHVKTALDSIYEINYSTENGLVNAMYPEGEMATVYTYRNCQGLANWSGIEYMMASFYLLLGDYEKGYNVMNTVQERYRRAGEIFNHAECGDHYYRPLSSWALMQALSGMSVNISQNKVTLSEKPLRDNCNEPWFTSSGYGQVKYNNGIWIITCAYGSLKADEVFIGERLTSETFCLKAGDSVIVKAEQ